MPFDTTLSMKNIHLLFFPICLTFASLAVRAWPWLLVLDQLALSGETHLHRYARLGAQADQIIE